MPLYLVESLGEQAESLATVPLVAYIASFLASLGVKAVSARISSKVVYTMLFQIKINFVPAEFIHDRGAYKRYCMYMDWYRRWIHRSHRRALHYCNPYR